MRKKLIPYHLVTFPSPVTRKQAPGRSIFKQNILSYSDDNLCNIFKINSVFLTLTNIALQLKIKVFEFSLLVSKNGHRMTIKMTDIPNEKFTRNTEPRGSEKRGVWGYVVSGLDSSSSVQ